MAGMVVQGMSQVSLKPRQATASLRSSSLRASRLSVGGHGLLRSQARRPLQVANVAAFPDVRPTTGGSEKFDYSTLQVRGHRQRMYLWL